MTGDREPYTVTWTPEPTVPLGTTLRDHDTGAVYTRTQHLPGMEHVWSTPGDNNSMRDLSWLFIALMWEHGTLTTPDGEETVIEFPTAYEPEPSSILVDQQGRQWTHLVRDEDSYTPRPLQPEDWGRRGWQWSTANEWFHPDRGTARFSVLLEKHTTLTIIPGSE